MPSKKVKNRAIRFLIVFVAIAALLIASFDYFVAKLPDRTLVTHRLERRIEPSGSGNGGFCNISVIDANTTVLTTITYNYSSPYYSSDSLPKPIFSIYTFSGFQDYRTGFAKPVASSEASALYKHGPKYIGTIEWNFTTPETTTYFLVTYDNLLLYGNLSVLYQKEGINSFKKTLQDSGLLVSVVLTIPSIVIAYLGTGDRPARNWR